MASFRYFVFFSILVCGRAARFVLLPSFGKSHFLVFAKLGQELTARGHEVQVVVGDTESYAAGHPKVRQYKTPRKFFQIMLIRHGPKKGLDVVTEMTGTAKLNAMYCDGVLNDLDLMNEIGHADLVVGDGLYQCSSLIASKFSLPHVVVVLETLSIPTMHAFRLPLPPSYVPQFKSTLTDKMSFLQRLKNVYHWCLVYWSFYYGIVPPFRELKEKYNIAPHQSVYETLERVDMIIAQKASILEYPRPSLPNTRVVGPLLAAPASPLPVEWEQFMQRSGDKGVIIVSFGTILGNFDKEILTKMLDAFSRIPQRVIWKLDRVEAKVSISDNIKVASWLPQNDILGHNKTQLFLNHGGVNGMMEAAFHGVPMVCAPFFGDQFDNAHMAKRIGFAEVVDLELATADELVEVILKVTSNSSYRDAAVLVSRSIKLLPRTPVQEAADWIEYAQAQGGLQYLRPRGLDLPFYKLYLLDILLVTVLTVLGMWLVINSLIGVLRNVFLSGNKEKKH